METNQFANFIRENFNFLGLIFGLTWGYLIYITTVSYSNQFSTKESLQGLFDPCFEFIGEIQNKIVRRLAKSICIFLLPVIGPMLFIIMYIFGFLILLFWFSCIFNGYLLISNFMGWNPDAVTVFSKIGINYKKTNGFFDDIGVAMMVFYIWGGFFLAYQMNRTYRALSLLSSAAAVYLKEKNIL